MPDLHYSYFLIRIIRWLKWRNSLSRVLKLLGQVKGTRCRLNLLRRRWTKFSKFSGGDKVSLLRSFAARGHSMGFCSRFLPRSCFRTVNVECPRMYVHEVSIDSHWTGITMLVRYRFHLRSFFFFEMFNNFYLKWKV